MPDDRVLGRGGGILDPRHNPPGAHNQNAIAQANQLIQILAGKKNAETSISSLAQRSADLGPRSDIHATGRIVEQEHAKIDREAFAKHHFLQVTPLSAPPAFAAPWF
jgi:hypothetical protein